MLHENIGALRRRQQSTAYGIFMDGALAGMESALELEESLQVRRYVCVLSPLGLLLLIVPIESIRMVGGPLSVCMFG